MEVPQIVTERRTVRNLQPLALPEGSRIAIVGEAPGEHEENHGIPFVGPSGQHLDRELRVAGIDRNRCLLANVCQVRPPGNKIELFPWESPEIQSGLAQLRLDLEAFQPNLCVLAGGTPLRAAKGHPAKISSWRGSLFRADVPTSPFYGYKCIPTLHPAFVLREYEGNPLFRFDLQRARDEGSTPNLVLPQRELISSASSSALCYVMDSWPAGVPCSVDIEGGLPEHAVNDNVKQDSKKRRHIGWRCVALSDSPQRAWAIAWWKFTDDEKCRLLRSFAQLMGRLDVPKVLQNALYDQFVLAFGYKILVRNVRDDTMVKGWEVYCELPKGLSTQASLWTREPHWKDEEMYESNGENLALGCCKDTAVTMEISIAQDGALKSSGLRHYRENMAILNPFLYMELRGINYDQENATLQRTTFQKEIDTLGDEINKFAGRELRGEKGSLGAQRLAKSLYEERGYPKQFKKEGGRNTDKLTTDIEALLVLQRRLPSDTFLKNIIRHRHIEGVLETLNVKPDFDGRVRCGYNPVGTDTGRVTCYTSPTGAGTNLQTITKSLRSNYRADPGFDFFQCDLSGADGWTVGAHCARLGDPTMLDDYLARLKPAKIVLLLHLFGRDFNLLDRNSIEMWSNGDHWSAVTDEYGGKGIYECTKQVYHGTDYLMGIPTMQTLVMKKSFKETGVALYLEHRTAAELQSCVFTRYPGLRTWHQWAEAKLVADGSLTSASGHTRQFFGRRFGRDIHDTVKKFLADEPQQNTTYATNLAMLRLWNDPENRRSDGSLIIEPLHQVHDALCGQWPQDRREWAIQKVKSYFNNPLTIAEIKITIPFDGAYGASWGTLTNKI